MRSAWDTLREAIEQTGVGVSLTSEEARVALFFLEDAAQRQTGDWQGEQRVTLESLIRKLRAASK